MDSSLSMNDIVKVRHYVSPRVYVGQWQYLVLPLGTDPRLDVYELR
jgi:hypothetical protein